MEPMSEIEFLRAEYITLVGRMGLLTSLSQAMMSLLLDQSPHLAAPLLQVMRENLAEKKYGGMSGLAAHSLEFERATFEAEIAPFLEAISKQ